MMNHVISMVRAYMQMGTAEVPPFPRSTPLVLVFTRERFSFRRLFAVSVSRRSVSKHEPCVARSRNT